MHIWLYVIVVNVVVLLLIKLLIFPPKKKLIVNPTEYEYINKAYLYVDNKVRGDIAKREEISTETVKELLNRIPVEIQHKEKLGIRNSYINCVLELQELVRSYKVCANKEMIRQIDDCLKLCDYTHICIMLEVRAILCAQISHNK